MYLLSLFMAKQRIFPAVGRLCSCLSGSGSSGGFGETYLQRLSSILELISESTYVQSC